MHPERQQYVVDKQRVSWVVMAKGGQQRAPEARNRDVVDAGSGLIAQFANLRRVSLVSDRVQDKRSGGPSMATDRDAIYYLEQSSVTAISILPHFATASARNGSIARCTRRCRSSIEAARKVSTLRDDASAMVTALQSAAQDYRAPLIDHLEAMTRLIDKVGHRNGRFAVFGVGVVADSNALHSWKHGGIARRQQLTSIRSTARSAICRRCPACFRTMNAGPIRIFCSPDETVSLPWPLKISR